MKLIVICALLFASASADVRPIYEFPEWWVDRGFEPSEWIQSRMRGGARIVGGQEAGRHQFPYQVGLRLHIRNSANVGTCGGSLVSNNRVITAAHCVDIVESVTSVLGAHFLLDTTEPAQVRILTPDGQFFWHEAYNPQTLVNDVAIINLPTPVTFNPQIQPVALPGAADGDFAGQPATASGWGRFGPENVISPFLRFVNVNVITNLACRVRFPTIIQDSTICTSGEGNVGACNGDSGGPLTIQRNGASVLIGVASFVSGLGCESGWPTGFARVTSFEPWFRARM